MFEWYLRTVACKSMVSCLNSLFSPHKLHLTIDAYIWFPESWERYIGFWIGRLHASITTRNSTVGKHLDDIVSVLLHESIANASTDLDEKQVVVERGYQIDSDWIIPSHCIVIDECLLDSIAQTMQRNDIVQTSIVVEKKICSCDLSTVTLTDVHAALLGMHLTHMSQRHFGAILSFKLITFLSMCIAIEFLPFEMVTVQVYLARDMLRSIAETYFEQQLVFAADEGSMRLAHRAGYNPPGMLWLLEYYARRGTPIYQYWRYLFPRAGWCWLSKPQFSPRQAALVPLVERICTTPDGQQPIRRTRRADRSWSISELV